MLSLLCAIAPLFFDGDWLVLTPRGGNPKDILSILRDNSKPLGAEEISKKVDYEFHKLSDGTTLFYPSTANERLRRKLQAQLINTLKKSVGSWTSNKDLPPDLRNYVNAQLHTNSNDHSVSLIASVNLTIGGKKKRITETIPPKDRSLPDKQPETYEDKLAVAYSLTPSIFEYSSTQARSVADQSKTIGLAAKYIEELFLDIDKELRATIAKSFEDNSSYSKRMQDLVTMSGRKVKDLPPDLQRFLLDQCFARGSVSLGDLADDMYTIDNTGYALEAHANYGGSSVVVLPIKTGS